MSALFGNNLHIRSGGTRCAARLITGWVARSEWGEWRHPPRMAEGRAVERKQPGAEERALRDNMYMELKNTQLICGDRSQEAMTLGGGGRARTKVR